jgi:hypothetical protein
MGIAVRHQDFSEAGRERSAIAIIASAVEQIREQFHDGLESASILRGQPSHGGLEVFVEFACLGRLGLGLNILQNVERDDLPDLVLPGHVEELFKRGE